MTTKYMTYVQVNDVTIETEKKKEEECIWRKEKFHSGTQISVGILCGNIQRAAKYRGCQTNVYTF